MASASSSVSGIRRSAPGALRAFCIFGGASVARAEYDPLERVHCDYLGAGLGPVIGWSFGKDTRGYRLLQGGVGGWLGAALPVSDELRQPVLNGTLSRVCVSLAVGVRFRFGGGAPRTDLFITPKAQYCAHPDFAA